MRKGALDQVRHALAALGVTELIAQEIGDDALVEAEADFLPLGADRHAVVGHHLAGAGTEGDFEGFQVEGELVARIDLLAAVGEVRVLAIFLRSAAGEVLGHAGDAGGAEPGVLGHATPKLAVIGTRSPLGRRFSVASRSRIRCAAARPPWRLALFRMMTNSSPP